MDLYGTLCNSFGEADCDQVKLWSIDLVRVIYKQPSGIPGEKT